INMGSKPLEDVEFKLVTDYPFQMLGADDGIRNLGTIQGHQKGEEGVILYYRVRIDEDASEGVNDLQLRFRAKGIEWAKLEDFQVRVQSVDAAVIVDSVELVPERITPGSNGRLTINLKNLADSTMEDVNLKLDLTLSSIQTATGSEASLLYDALPFAPTSSTTEKRISSIKSGETVPVVYDLTVYPDATSRVYKVPLVMTYKDELDTEYTKNEMLGITVGSKPDLYVVIDKSDLVAGKKTGVVSFKFVNRGVTDIKFLDVLLQSTDEYEVVSSYEEYIGNIDSDDFESIEFSVYLKNNKDPEIVHTMQFPLKITYKDANNLDYEDDLVLEHKIYTAEEKGQTKSNSAMYIGLAVLVMIIGWIVYRNIVKRRRKKLEQSEK
ncbi:TPA: hypothetical protein HA265_02925, partial [Candidatus Woesearchaeota archaeon]|nr:hypothetical protein [Candidatus Woesearchaeota archaeon]